MSLAQLQALTGKRYKRPYVEEINAQTPQLPALYNIKRQQKYYDDANALAQERIDNEAALGKASLDIAQKQADEAEKNRKRATRLGYVNTALNAGLGIAGLAQAYGGGGGPGGGSSGLSVGEATNILTATGASPTPIAPVEASGGFDFTEDILKPIGGGLLDIGSGLYDATIGNIIDLF